MTNQDLPFVCLQEKQKIGPHHRCEFYEEESRGYFRFRSTVGAEMYVSFFKSNGKPFHKNQTKPKIVCSEFIKAATTQPVHNSLFKNMPRSHVTAPPPPPTTTTTTTTTAKPPTTVANWIVRTTLRPAHKHRHQNHHHHYQQENPPRSKEEFSGPDTRRTRLQNHQQQKQQQSPKRRITKKKRIQGQKGAKKSQKLQSTTTTTTTPRSRSAGEKRIQKQVEVQERRNFADYLFLDEKALQLEQQRAVEAAQQLAREEKLHRQEVFEDHDYSNDDHMQREGKSWERRQQQLDKRHTELSVKPVQGKQQQQSDSISANHLMGKDEVAASGEFKGHARRKSWVKKLKKINYRSSSNGSSGGGSLNNSGSFKRHAERWSNSHHHPTEKSRGS